MHEASDSEEEEGAGAGPSLKGVLQHMIQQGVSTQDGDRSVALSCQVVECTMATAWRGNDDAKWLDGHAMETPSVISTTTMFEPRKLHVFSACLYCTKSHQTQHSAAFSPSPVSLYHVDFNHVFASAPKPNATNRVGRCQHMTSASPYATQSHLAITIQQVCYM